MFDEIIQKCNGCHACYSICPISAIKMEKDKDGFLYPKINYDQCIGCKKCISVCPIINIKQSDFLSQSFAIVNNCEEIRMKSSSGGTFYAIAEEVINQSGIVFGARFNNDNKVIHSWTNNLNELENFCGSKYVQSEIGNAFIECERFLKQEITVLFTGTPCQIIGLKKYLKKDYYNLLCIDIVCHGCPSQKLLEKYINYFETKEHSKIVDVKFRNKDNGWKNYNVSLLFANEKKILIPHDKDFFMNLFLSDKGLRKSCYYCIGRGTSRMSDITLGDFWGVQNELPKVDDDKGVSFAFCSSDKGLKIIDNLKDCSIEKIEIECGLKHNPAIIKSPLKPKCRDKFYTDIDKLTFDNFVRKYTYVSVFNDLYLFIRRLLGKMKRLLIRVKK